MRSVFCNPALVASLLALTIALSAPAASLPTLIDFEKIPPIPTQPSLFSLAGPTQTITAPGVATISGGVVLGNATNFPAESFATAPNAYGTSNIVAGSALPSTLTISIDPAYSATEVSFPVFNGITASRSYIATAFDGASVVATRTLSQLPANTNSGFTTVDFLAPNITSVTLTPADTSIFDFAIDSIALNESVQQALPTASEPASLLLLGSGLAALVVLGSHRHRRTVSA